MLKFITNSIRYIRMAIKYMKYFNAIAKGLEVTAEELEKIEKEKSN